MLFLNCMHVWRKLVTDMSPGDINHQNIVLGQRKLKTSNRNYKVCDVFCQQFSNHHRLRLIKTCVESKSLSGAYRVLIWVCKTNEAPKAWAARDVWRHASGNVLIRSYKNCHFPSKSFLNHTKRSYKIIWRWLVVT